MRSLACSRDHAAAFVALHGLAAPQIRPGMAGIDPMIMETLANRKIQKKNEHAKSVGEFCKCSNAIVIAS